MNDHPIMPPPELVQDWLIDGTGKPSLANYIATQAAQWGADQELEACCDTLQRHAHWDLAVCELMADRRPKPPSLKEQALRDLDALAKDLERNGMGFGTAMIRRALEALDD